MTAAAGARAAGAGPARRMQLGRIALTLAIGAAGGALFRHFNLPLAWMIGALFATTAASIAGVPLLAASRLRMIMVAVLGVMLGSAFSPATAARIVTWWPTVAALALYIAVVTGLLTLYFRRVAGYDWVTAYFSASPGGLNEMVMVGSALGGNDRTIALVHAVRILLVVIAIPFGFVLFGGYQRGSAAPLGISLIEYPLVDFAILTVCAVAGAVLARALRVPAALMVGPMVASAAIHLAGVTASRPPGELVAAAQVVIGSTLGARFAGIRPYQIARVALSSGGATVIMLALTLGFSLALEPLAGSSMQATLLSFAPGGLAEMSLIALALHVDAAFVSTHHVVRIVLIVMLSPLLFRTIRGIRGRRKAPTVITSDAD
ncbi:MAG TPA: AbrB family transcriptional regulator [Alphaproteobacteria bacterium]|nr:AbrB family transcriptional regulator [Alphaproteobacteria bacterium]